MKKRTLIIAFSALSILLLTTACNKEEPTKIGSISVREAVLNKKKMEIKLAVNETLQLTVDIMPRSEASQKLAFETVASDIVSISQEGLLSGKKIGKDTLTISATDGSGIFVRYPIDVVNKK